MTIHVHKKTGQILHNITRRGRHYTSSRYQQTKIRYCGYDENGENVELTPTEFRQYVDGIKVGTEWREGGYQHKIVEATQKTKLTATVKIDVYAKSGPRKGHLWFEELTMQGIVI